MHVDQVFVDKVDAVREQVLSVMEDDFFQKFIVSVCTFISNYVYELLCHV